jgi:hypothetical protein
MLYTSRPPLATCDGIDVLQTLRQGVLLPGPPAIVCAKDLSAPRGTVDLLGVLATNRHGHHSAAWRHVMVEAFPALAQILAAV